MGDRVIWIVYFFLCMISLVEVFSAGSSFSYKGGSFWLPLLRQAGFLAGGTVVAIALHRVPCRMYKVVPIFLVPVSILLLCITLFSGAALNDGKRWLSVVGIQFQPSEIAKGAVVICTAWILSHKQREDGADKSAFKIIMSYTIPICLLILVENLSTACLLFGVVVLMMFIGRVPMKQIGGLFGVLALIGAIFLSILMVIPKDVNFSDNRLLHRMETWSNRLSDHSESIKEGAFEDPQAVDLDKDAQVSHANIAIASSNIIGKMPGNSVERDFLSQAFSDFIFAIIVEETGFVGAFSVVFLYIVLLFRAGRIASRCERNFPPFLIMGLTLLLVSQAVLNMMVAVGLFPVTGQPLPLISRGGTSTLINSAYIGMILSVSRYARQVSTPQHTRFDGTMKDIKHE